MAEVERVGEQERVVRPDVERDRQGQRRVDPRRRRVERELADRDRHPAGALVAEAEDPLVVGDDDQPDVVVRAVSEQLRDPVDVGRGDPQAARPADDVAELLAGPPDRRGVDDRQELLGVLGQEPVEERRVAVLERGQADVLLERVVLAAEVLELELDLLLDRQDPVGQEPARPNALALVGREREVLGQEPGPEQGRRAQARRGPAGRPRCRRTGRGGDARSLESIGLDSTDTMTTGSSPTPRPRSSAAGSAVCTPRASSAGTSGSSVTLVDRRNHHLFAPLLYQVATGAVSPGDIAQPLRSILRRQRNTTVLLGEAVGLDPERREVRMSDGGPIALRHADRRRPAPVTRTSATTTGRRSRRA